MTFSRTISLLFILFPALLFAQPSLENVQKEWLNSLQAGNSVSDIYWEGQSLIFSKIATANSQGIQQLFKSEMISSAVRYHHKKTYKHDKSRYITIGTLETDSDSLLLLTGWRKIENSWKKEIDVLLTKETKTTKTSPDLQQLLNQERMRWVKLANQHNPQKHIKHSYTEGATYFGNGKKSEGHSAIAERYFYMENPNYQVNLEKEQLWKLSENRVLEIGRYFTGAERTGTGGLYTILWEKQADGKWQIELDFNF